MFYTHHQRRVSGPRRQVHDHNCRALSGPTAAFADNRASPLRSVDVETRGSLDGISYPLRRYPRRGYRTDVWVTSRPTRATCRRRQGQRRRARGPTQFHPFLHVDIRTAARGRWHTPARATTENRLSPPLHQLRVARGQHQAASLGVVQQQRISTIDENPTENPTSSRTIREYMVSTQERPGLPHGSTRGTSPRSSPPPEGERGLRRVDFGTACTPPPLRPASPPPPRADPGNVVTASAGAVSYNLLARR